MKLLDREVDELADWARAVALRKGEVLVSEGDDAREVFYVRSGTLDAVTAGLNGEILLGQVGSGALVGEVAVVTGQVRMATLRAAEDSVVFAIPRGAFEAWMRTRRDVADNVAAGARERIDRAKVAAMIQALVGAADQQCIQAVLDAVTWTRIEAGDVLLREGDVSAEAYFVVSGRLVATSQATEGGERRLSEIGGGEIIGELGLLDAAPRSATVRALRDSTLACFTAASFTSLVEHHPALALHVARGVLRRIAHPSAQGGRATSIAVAVVAPTDRRSFANSLANEIARFGSIAHLSSERVDSMLHEIGVAHRQVDDLGLPRLSELLHQADVENDHVLYEADTSRQLTAWTRRCLRYADRTLVVISSNPTEDEQARLDEVVGELRRLDGARWWLAILHRRSIVRPSGGATLRARLGAEQVVHLREGSSDDIARLARLAVGRGLGLVLSGGGARGFAHIGVVRALHELGVDVDEVGGASIGAPIGAGVALGLHPTELLETVTRQFHGLLDYTVPVVSVLKGARITKSIDDSLGGIDIEDLWRGYYCVSTNLTASRLEIHRQGDLALAVRASVAIPGVLPPVPFAGDLLVDGGVLANLPVEPMRARPGIGSILAINVASAAGPRARVDYGTSISGWRALRSSIRRGRSPYPSLSGVLMRTMIVGSLRDQPVCNPQSDELFIDIDCKGVNLLAFERVEPVARMGYEAAKPALESWLATRRSAV